MLSSARRQSPHFGPTSSAFAGFGTAADWPAWQPRPRQLSDQSGWHTRHQQLTEDEDYGVEAWHCHSVAWKSSTNARSSRWQTDSEDRHVKRVAQNQVVYSQTTCVA